MSNTYTPIYSENKWEVEVTEPGRLSVSCTWWDGYDNVLNIDGENGVIGDSIQLTGTAVEQRQDIKLYRTVGDEEVAVLDYTGKLTLSMINATPLNCTLFVIQNTASTMTENSLNSPDDTIVPDVLPKPLVDLPVGSGGTTATIDELNKEIQDLSNQRDSILRGE